MKHNPQSKHQWQLEFFDQTIDRVDFFIPLNDTAFAVESFGDDFVFRAPGKKVLIVVNDNDADKTFEIKFNGRVAEASLPGGAVGTFVW